MSYLVQRHDRYYVVAYDGIDPRTGHDRRRWRAAGTCLADAEAMRDQLDRENSTTRVAGAPRGATFAAFLTKDWLPRKRRTVGPTTAHRYTWFVDHCIVPALGEVRLRQLRASMLDRFYGDLLDHGGHRSGPLAPKTVYDIHVVVRGALADAQRRRLVTDNVADLATPPRHHNRRPVPLRSWTAAELRHFLDHAVTARLYPALHPAAVTGMRRGEVLGIHWNDINHLTCRLSVSRSVQLVGTRAVEAPCKTRSSRRCIDLNTATLTILNRWADRQRSDNLPIHPDAPVFTGPHGKILNPDVLTQTFERIVRSAGLPRIRLHDLRHTHASLLVQAGTPIKVVAERLGHANPGFTMQTYQHVLPGMQTEAAHRFAALLAPTHASSTEDR